MHSVKEGEDQEDWPSSVYDLGCYLLIGESSDDCVFVVREYEDLNHSGEKSNKDSVSVVLHRYRCSSFTKAVSNVDTSSKHDAYWDHECKKAKTGLASVQNVRTAIFCLI